MWLNDKKYQCDFCGVVYKAKDAPKQGYCIQLPGGIVRCAACQNKEKAVAAAKKALGEE